MGTMTGSSWLRHHTIYGGKEMRIGTRAIGIIVMAWLSASALAWAQASVRWSSDTQMHSFFMDRFLQSRGNGFSRTLDIPMQVWDGMRLIIDCDSAAKGKSLDPGEYKLKKLELIGIAKHSSPVAFTGLSHTSAGRPETRSLNAFEQKALSEFSESLSVVGQTDKSGNGTVVAAVRAGAECLSCHQEYKVGSVLGAFSYQLTAVPPEKRPAGK
jgi:hypothetical protein